MTIQESALTEHLRESEQDVGLALTEISLFLSGLSMSSRLDGLVGVDGVTTAKRCKMHAKTLASLASRIQGL